MSRLVLTSALLKELRTVLLSAPEETCAVLFGHAAFDGERLVRLVVREAVYPAPGDYVIRTGIAARLSPEFVATIAQRARKTGESIVFAHSHPFSFNQFSKTDDLGELALAEFLKERTPTLSHATLLVTPEVTIARQLGSDQTLLVTGVGESVAFGHIREMRQSDERFDRQVRMFGSEGQRRLSQLRVAIVGLGGTGSVVLEQLMHLGVNNLCLIDPDIVDASNLNRLVGATEGDIGKAKVQVGADLVRRFNPSANVAVFQESVLMAKVAARLIDTDFVFCCTDSQGSRSVLNQLAYQYLIPMVDLGVSIVVGQQGITHLAGRVNMLAPGLGCFVCGNLLDPEAVRVDLLTDYERKNDPYILGAREPAPAVISLNSTVASMAVTMFMGAVLGIPGNARFINYNGITGSARPAAISPHLSCVVCSAKGALARATEWPLPGRLT